MAYELRAVPKPPKKTRVRGGCRLAQQKPMKRTRMKRIGKGSAFPRVRDKQYCRWVATENVCLLLGRFIRAPFSAHDVVAFHPDPRTLVHYCWGPIDPAHVGKHQAKGAPDFGCVVPLCRAAHQFYDEHRSEWPKVTGYTERKMASAASGLALKYLETGGRAA